MQGCQNSKTYESSEANRFDLELLSKDLDFGNSHFQ